MNDVNVDRRGEGSLIERMNCKPFLVASVQVPEFQMFVKLKDLPLVDEE